jgi:hypothetical protein
MNRVLLGLVLISVMLFFSGFADVINAQESVPLPSVGDRFIYHVKVTGNREATKEEANEHEETYVFMGTRGVKGQTRDGIVENSKEYNSVW